jgi:hypothetical protein
MNNWTDFNDAQFQSSFTLIPKGTVAPVRMTIKPGGYDDASRGWNGGYATQSADTGSVYLAAEFVILDGPFARRKIWGNIGLFSQKGPAWADMGRSFIRAMLNSARNVGPNDTSAAAIAARRVTGFQDLDGIEFIARIDQEKNGRGEWRNAIKTPIEPDHPDYAAARATTGTPSSLVSVAPPVPLEMTPRSITATPAMRKPLWAQ